MNLKIYFSIIFISLIQIYTKASDVIYRNQVFDDSIKTVKIFIENNPLSFPAIELYSSDKLTLIFDDLYDENSDYKYEIIHCDANWRKTQINENEYINKTGFLYFNSPKSSINTRINFNHYKLTIPNDDFSFRISGNYIIRVINEKTEKTIFDKRFIVYENLVQSIFNVKRADIVTLMDEYHDIDLTIVGDIFSKYDAYSEITVKVMQNEWWDNTISLTPEYVKADEASYYNPHKNVVLAGNEYRNVSMKTIDYKTNRINDINYKGTHFEIQLKDDEPLRFKRYKDDGDINGKSFVSYNAQETEEISSDYYLVHFNLPYEAPDIFGEIHILGEITNWETSSKSKMEYNYEAKAYQKSIWIKQGYFDYLYLLKPDIEQAFDIKHIDGSFYKTKNEYFLFAYLKERMIQYDRIIAFSTTKSIIEE